MGNDNTFTSDHKNNIEGWLFSDKIKEPFLSKNIPVIIGETSASDKGNSGERNKWAKCFFGAAKNLSVSCILWDNMVVYPNGSDKAERHGYFNRKTCQWF